MTEDAITIIRGKRILLTAVMLVVVGMACTQLPKIVRAPTTDALRRILGLGIWVMACYYAFKGGSKSLLLLRVLAVFMLAVIMIVWIVIGLFQFYLPRELDIHFSDIVRSMPGLLSVVFLLWALFFSSAVKSYLGSIRTRAEPFSAADGGQAHRR